MELLLDADATVAMRGLSLLAPLLESSAGIAFTGYIYDHELGRPKDLERLRQLGRISVHHLLVRTPADQRRRTLLREERIDKGEAEAIAWLLDDAKRGQAIWYVTLDNRARKVARALGLRAVDVAEVAAALVAASVIDLHTVRALLSVWDDLRNQSGRPKRWDRFDTEFPRLIADVRDRWGEGLG